MLKGLIFWIAYAIPDFCWPLDISRFGLPTNKVLQPPLREAVLKYSTVCSDAADRRRIRPLCPLRRCCTSGTKCNADSM